MKNSFRNLSIGLLVALLIFSSCNNNNTVTIKGIITSTRDVNINLDKLSFSNSTNAASLPPLKSPVSLGSIFESFTFVSGLIRYCFMTCPFPFVPGMDDHNRKITKPSPCDGAVSSWLIYIIGFKLFFGNDLPAQSKSIRRLR